MDRKDSYKYLNFILTIIAILLLLIYLKPMGGITPKIGAAEPPENYGMVRDEAVAGATREVAQANKDIAGAIDKLSSSMDTIGASIEKIAASYEKAKGTPSEEEFPEPEAPKSELQGKIEVKKPAPKQKTK